MGPRQTRPAPRLRRAPLSRFRHFAAIDWSGAVGERLPGIAVALCGPEGAPQLVRPGHRWSRAEILAWLLAELPEATLVGLDLGTSLPFADRAAFFPGWRESPPDARSLWSLIDHHCARDAHLAATGFLALPEAAAHFRQHGGRQGSAFEPGRGRLRVTEHAQRAMGLSPVSNLNLVGAAQVGKSSLTGMRVLHRLAGRLPVWPFDADPGQGSLVVEIYTSLAARAAGRRPGRSKMRSAADLDTALAALGSPPSGLAGAIDDHRSDAILTAAWLRIAAGDAALWHPPALTRAIAHTEGWTFGVR